MSNKIDGSYAHIPSEEVAESGKIYPLKAALMMYANNVLDEAEAQATGQKKREPSFHRSGWKITLHNGSAENAVGLESCWLEDRFYLGYPNAAEVPDDIIIKTLGVEYANAVPQVSAISVNDPNYKGEYKDPDKPLEKNEFGQIIAYRDEGKKRLWAKFFGPREEKGGRVWIEKSGYDFLGYHMPIIINTNELFEVYFGHGNSNGISTAPFSYYNKYSPESPTAKSEAIQKYRNKFMDLFVEVALLIDRPSKVTFDYGFVMVPEDLEKEGYGKVEWLKGSAGTRKGWKHELVRAEKEGEIVMLESGNSLVPWSTIRQLDIPETSRNREGLVKIINDSLTF
ncbi:MAG: hypothetical protein PHG05_00950 [Candidatus Nanoarchaeia archaeon]|nr:hypothetical protein [Candidatus Nanoarchaeia archaeon]